MNIINDTWPDPEDMPDEVKEALAGLHRIGQQNLAEIEANPHHRAKSWWQIDKTTHGSVKQVWLNKVTGSAAGLWTFEPTIDDAGQPIIRVQQCTHVDDLSAVPVGSWQVPADIPDQTLAEALSDLVGQRSAKAAVARLQRNRK